MKVNGRLVGVGLAVVTVGFWFVAASGTAAQDADLKSSVNKIADALAKKDKAAAEKDAKAIAAKADLEDVMHLLSLRKSKGFGVGATPNTITPDGIEAKIINMTKRALPKAQLDKESADLTRMAYQAAAVGEVAHAKPPDKDEGKKKKSDWLKWSADMRDAALKLADVSKAKDAMAVKTAATKLYSSCTTCHEVFRD